MEPLNEGGREEPSPRRLLEDLAAGRPVSRQPSAILAGGAWILNANRITMKDLLGGSPDDMADTLINTYRAVGSDILWAAPGSGGRIVNALGGKVKFNPHGPAESLEPLIKTEADLETIDLGRIDRDVSLERIREVTGAIAERAGEERYLAAGMWGPLTMAGLLMGIEELSRNMYKNKPFIKRVLDVTSDIFLHYMEGYTARGVDLIWMAEPTASGDMISRRHFEEFALPALQKVFAAASRFQPSRGRAITALHICGNIENRLDIIPLENLDILSVDFKVSLKKSRSVLGDRVILAGNVNPVDMRYESEAAVRKASLDCIEAAQGGPFLLMPGCDIPPATPFENIRAMTGAQSGA